MTIEKDSFEGLMKSLNINVSQFQTYKIHPELNYNQLSIIKDDVENQLHLLFDLLQNKYGFDMEMPLLTSDGFPRGDVDVVSIRLIRVKIIRLRNDHRYLLSLLESKLIEQFQSPQQNLPTTIQDSEEKVESNIPFAIVEEVISGSPAELAGIKLGDKIVVFDNTIHAGNHDKLTKVISRVQSNIDKTISIDILRQQNIEQINLTPTNNWPGRGVLGCKILPI